MHFKSIPSSFRYIVTLFILISPIINGKIDAQNPDIGVFNLPKEQTGIAMFAQEQTFLSIHDLPFALTDSVLIFNNYTSSDSSKYNKTTFEYSPTNQILNISYQKPDDQGDNWIKYKLYKFSFDQQQRQTQYLHRELNDETGAWEDQTKREFKYYQSENFPISIAEYKWDATSESWTGNWKNHYQYDEFENPILSESFIWNVTQFDWKITTREEVLYNTNNQALQKVSYYKNHDQNIWIGNQKTSYWHNEIDQQVEELTQFWDSNANAWINSFKKQFTYTDRGEQSGWETFRWDRNRQHWSNWWKVDKQYDTNGYLVGLFNFEWSYLEEKWIEGWQISNHYDPENNQQEETGLIWNAENENWEGFYKLFHEYDDDYSIKTVSDYAWDNNQEQWILNQKRFHFLSTPNFLPFTLRIIDINGEDIDQATVSINGHLYDQGEYFFTALPKGTLEITVNAEGYMTKTLDHLLSEDNHERTIILLVVPHQIDHNDFLIFPNPAYNDVFIQSPADNTILNVQLYSLNGQKIRSIFPNQESGRMPVSDLPSGLYLLHVETNSGLKIEKIIVGHR